MASTSTRLRGEDRWEPLPKIAYGFAIYPFAPASSLPSSTSTHSNGSQAENSTQGGTTDSVALMADLEVGDEVYAFEKFVPRHGGERNMWYRGYVVASTKTPSAASLPSASTSSDPSSSRKQTLNTPSNAEPSVYLGIFPASFIHVREELNDAEGRLSTVWDELHNPKQPGSESGSVGGSKGKGKAKKSTRKMEALAEEEEDENEDAEGSTRRRRRRGDEETEGEESRRPSGQTEETEEGRRPRDKVPPPIPSLKAGDETVSGATEALVDEIATALREWYSRMFTYLLTRNYRLFHIVRQHVTSLHVGRRHLLDQNLGTEELSILRRDCVARLVKGNVAQGLDVIVRHPVSGGLVTVSGTDGVGEVDIRSWVSGIRMYSMQVASAYIDATSASQPLGNGLDVSGKNALGVPSSTSKSSILPQPTEFSTLPSRHSISLSQQSNSMIHPPTFKKQHQTSPDEPSTGDFCHLFIELRAFVANPCMPSETSELCFALYSRSINQYISEEFLVVMNSHGMPVANSEAEGLGKRVRTLFRDLGPQDVGEVVLVCRIVRCGAMKMSAVGSLASSGSNIRSSSASSMNEQQPPSETSSITNGRSSGAGQQFLQPPSASHQQQPSSSSRSGKTSTAPFRRPFGCAVVDVSQFVKGAEDATTKPREVAMQIFVPVDESNFATLHEDIIQSRTNQFERSPRADMIAIDLKFFFGRTPAIVKENPSLVQGCPQTQRLGFPDVVFPGSTRNDLYVKLWSADFNGSGGGSIRMRKGMSSFGVGASSTTSQSYQVNVEVRTREGITLDRSISRGAGEPPVRTFSSLVFGRNVTPTFGELIKISNIPVEIMAGCHLYFNFRQRAPIRDKSTPSDSAGLEQPFAFAYLPLVPEEGASFVPDGDHTLILYRMDKPSQLPIQYLEAPSSLSYGSSIEAVRVPSQLARVLVPLRDSMIIRSFLCSTTFTQSEVLLRLLNWEKGGLLENTTELTAVLAQFRFVSEVEVVKVLGPIFDSLFAIMVANPSERVAVEGLVFEALVTVLGIVQDRRFTNFKPVLDVYIDKHFSSASVWNQLIRSMSGLLADKSSKQLRAAIKVWHYIFRFISRSRDLQKYKDAGMGGTSERLREHLDSSFKSGLALLLRDFNDLMKMTEPSSIIGTQTIALQHFSDILPDLARTFDAQELAEIVISFSDAVPRTTGKAVIWKLLLHLQSARSVVFDDAEARASLVPALVRWVKPHLGRYQESVLVSQTEVGPSRDNARIAWVDALRLAVTVVAVMLDKLSEAVNSPEISKNRNALNGERDNIDLVFSCFPMLLESYHELRNPETLEVVDRHRSVTTVAVPVPVVFPSTYPFALVAHRPEQHTIEGAESTSVAPTGLNIALGEIAVVICVLVNVQPIRALHLYLQEQIEVEGIENVNRMLSSFYKASSSILAFDAFPSNWINCSIMAHNSILKLADEAGRVMQRYNIPEDSDSSSFDSVLWKSCFDMMFALLSSDEVVIEAFGPQKRRAVWKLAGDIRGDGILVLHRLWDSIGWPSVDEGTVSFGRYQVQFLSLVQPVLTLCLSQYDMLRTRAVQILYTMILSEWSLQGNFREVESEVIDKLDELMEKDNDGDNHTRDYFVSALRLLFSGPSVDPQLQEAVTTWLNSVDQFLKLLISLRDLPDGEEYQDDRVVSTLRLLNFLRSVGGRDTMYISYVHQLVASHVRSGDFTEAGLTLKLHASLYEWNRNSFVEPFVFGELELPRQSQFGRKESLYLQTLDYLGRGKAFELAIEVCKELEYQHQNTTFDYTRLAELLSHHSRLLESIVAEPQPYPHYFMVNYFGPFPLAVRGQRFVYRGSEWQKFGGFCDQLQNKHPQAKLIKSIILPDHVENGDELYIQVLAVQPEPDKSLPVFNPSVAKEIRTYYETSNVNVFSHSRPFNKSGRFGGERDIADVFIEKTFVTCQESFPTVLRRSEIKNTWVVEISSITSAVSDVRAKSVELEALEESYTTLSETGQELNTNPLSMALNGAVDAPMNGGVPAYRKAFFSPQFVAQNPDKSGEIDALRAAIEDQTRILARCIDLHGLVVPDAMTPFHLTIEQFFHKTFAEEISRIGIALPVGLGDEAPSALGVAAQRHREERARSVSAKATQSSPVRVTNFLSSSNYTNGSAERERQSSTQSRVSADARSFGSTNSSPGRRLSSIGSLAVGTGQLPRASNGSGGGGGGGDGRETSGGFLSPTSNSRPPTRSEGDLSDSGPLSWSPTLGKKDGSSLGRFSSLMRRKEKEPKRNGV